MTRRNGFTLIEILIYASIALAILGAIAGVIHAWNSFTSGLVEKGRTAGVSEERARYVERDNKQLQAVLAERDRLLREREATEKAHQDQLQSQENENAKKLAAAQKDYDAFIGDLNAGRIVFRVPGTGSRGCASGSDQGAPSAVAGGAGASPGHLGGGGLRGENEDAIFLLTEAHRANRVLAKLNSCRGYISTIRGEPRP